MNILDLQKYLKHMGIDMVNVSIAELEIEENERMFQITVTGIDVIAQMQNIVKQFDRDMEHLIVISGQEMRSRVIVQPTIQTNGLYIIVGLDMMLYN